MYYLSRTKLKISNDNNFYSTAYLLQVCIVVALHEI